ncbi:MAG TPA: ComF family protein, partial [Rhodocyclaceae bacterium]|nr:ComF family protein [Rhodocyclaceae bacterium]
MFAYTSPVREMLLALKAGNGFHVRAWLATFLSDRAGANHVDCIVPMPLHDNRLAERGFNQSLELAGTLAKTSGKPLLKSAVLREIDTPHQTGLRLKARQRNVRGAFRCLRRFDGQHVLVVDDVMTSGSSLNELARTLKLA